MRERKCTQVASTATAIRQNYLATNSADSQRVPFTGHASNRYQFTGHARNITTPCDGTIAVYLPAFAVESVCAHKSLTRTFFVRIPTRVQSAEIFVATDARLNNNTAREPSFIGFDQTWVSLGEACTIVPCTPSES